jgi:biopolymer transport protein ExbD
MGMANKNSDQDEIVSDINMTPLIDVMLVLLIIFMVTSSAAIESGLTVDLPETTVTVEAPPSSLVISLSDKGQIFIGGSAVSLAELKEKVGQGLAAKKTADVVLEGDGDSSLTHAFEVMNVAREAGAKTFSLAAKVKGE